MQKYLEIHEQRYPLGTVPEALADLRRVIDEIMTFDETKPVTKDFVHVRFWNRDVGKDMFVGNCVGSCTALGSNASAIFEFLLDQGTQYAVIENQKGEVKGYARFFLALDGNQQPIIFIDSVDGQMAGNHYASLKNHIQKLAEMIGIPSDRVYDRESGNIYKKIGGVLTENYFHHSGANLSPVYTDSSIDNWTPQGGWPAIPQLEDKAIGTEKPSDVGGIDVTEIESVLENRGEEIQFDFPKNLQYLETTPIKGLEPKVLGIILLPAANLPAYLGLNEAPQEEIANRFSKSMK